jgi:hypothetical protein
MEDVNKRIDNLESVVRNISNKLELFLKSYSEKLEAEILEEKEKEEISPPTEDIWNSALYSEGVLDLSKFGNMNSTAEYNGTSIKVPEVRINKLLLLDTYMKTVEKLLE